MRKKETVFRFKRFSVSNANAAMKVGTDGVLLGAWCDIDDAQRVLDVGTGTGLIALMVAQRNPSAFVDAVEIDLDACDEARLNVENSTWKDNIKIFNTDFKDYVRSCEVKYDVIVSNPPFFTNGVLPLDVCRMMARHTATLDMSTLIHGACELLKPSGKLCIISPVESSIEIEEATIDAGMCVHRKTHVYSKEGKPAKRILWEIVTHFTGEIIDNSLFIELSQGGYTEEYISLTRDFYLKM